MSTLGEFLACIQQVETIPCPATEEWADLIKRISAPGRIVEVTEESYWHFLEVLPPKAHALQHVRVRRGRRTDSALLAEGPGTFLPATHPRTDGGVLLSREDFHPVVGGSMLYCLSFAPEFFRGTVPIEKLKPSSRPTNVYQAVLSLSHDRWTELARDVFDCDPDKLDVETVIQKIEETNTCANLDPPAYVHIDQDGWFSIHVYEEVP